MRTKKKCGEGRKTQGKGDGRSRYCVCHRGHDPYFTSRFIIIHVSNAKFGISCMSNALYQLAVEWVCVCVCTCTVCGGWSEWEYRFFRACLLVGGHIPHKWCRKKKGKKPQITRTTLFWLRVGVCVSRGRRNAQENSIFAMQPEQPTVDRRKKGNKRNTRVNGQHTHRFM